MVKSSTPAPVPQPTLPPVHDLSSQPFPSHFPQGVSLLQAYPQVDIAASTAAIVNSITPMPNIPANVTDILSSLLNAGVLSTSGISATVKSPAIENETSSESKKTHSTNTEVPFYRECRPQYLRLSEVSPYIVSYIFPCLIFSIRTTPRII